MINLKLNTISHFFHRSKKIVMAMFFLQEEFSLYLFLTVFVAAILRMLPYSHCAQLYANPQSRSIPSLSAFIYFFK